MDPWRWMTYGLGGLIGMMTSWAKEGGIMTYEQVADLERYIGLLSDIAKEQKTKRDAMQESP